MLSGNALKVELAVVQQITLSTPTWVEVELD
jgi:hypothetical protein